jgi:hypothetical protein
MPRYAFGKRHNFSMNAKKGNTMGNRNKSTTPENPGNLANTGNASNPSPGQDKEKQAEKYLRESGNIEDYPDATDMEDAEKTMEEKAKGPNSKEGS